MPDLNLPDGELLAPGSAGYHAALLAVGAAHRRVRPRLVLRCRSVADVVAAVEHAAGTGEQLVPRGGGHCFAGRSSTDGIVLDLAGLDAVTVAGDGIATVGAGARLGRVYAALHAHGRTVPAGCGPTVGLTGLTLGGGIGLLGRLHGLTCDRLVGARVVLADGSVVDCAEDREPDLFWALRGAGGGQFGVVTSLRLATVAEPVTTRVEAHWSGAVVDELAAIWQDRAPDLPDEVTVNLTLTSVPGAPVAATLFGAATLDVAATGDLLRDFGGAVDLRPGLPFHELKDTFADPREPPAQRLRSEFFAHPVRDGTRAALLAGLGADRAAGRREITFTALGGAYNRVAEDATAFAHRGGRFQLEHIAAIGDPWVDDSWATAHPDGSGRVYPNFPDPALDDWAGAYHAANHARLVAVKNAYDPDRFFDFHQAI